VMRYVNRAVVASSCWKKDAGLRKSLAVQGQEALDRCRSGFVGADVNIADACRFTQASLSFEASRIANVGVSGSRQ